MRFIFSCELEVLRVENVKCVPNSFYGKLACIAVGVRRCAGAAQISVSEGKLCHFGNTLSDQREFGWESSESRRVRRG